MKINIIFDSYFGCTEKIAQKMGEELGLSNEIRVLRVNEVNPKSLTGMDYLIIGSPTRAFKPTPAISSFIKRIPKTNLLGVRFAAFDTRFSENAVTSSFLKSMMKLFGYAAKKSSKMLKKKGGIEVMPPKGFIVKDTEGPLRDGELDRAKTWANQILSSR